MKSIKLFIISTASFVFLLFSAVPFAHSFMRGNEGLYCHGEGFLAYNIQPDNKLTHIYVVVVGGTEGIKKYELLSSSEELKSINCNKNTIALLFPSGEKIFRFKYPDSFNEIYRKWGAWEKPKGLVKHYGYYNRSNLPIDILSKDKKYSYTIEEISDSTAYSEARIVQYLDKVPLRKLPIYKETSNFTIKAFNTETLQKTSENVITAPVAYKEVENITSNYSKDKRKLMTTAQSIETLRLYIDNPMNSSKVDEAMYFLGLYKERLAYLVGYVSMSPRIDEMTGSEIRIIVELVKRNRHEFIDDGRLGGILYNGNDWTRLIERYPDSIYADEVIYRRYSLNKFAYENDTLDPFFECWIQHSKFEGLLINYPENKYVPKILSNINSACDISYYDNIIEHIKDLSDPTEGWGFVQLQDRYIDKYGDILGLYENISVGQHLDAQIIETMSIFIMLFKQLGEDGMLTRAEKRLLMQLGLEDYSWIDVEEIPEVEKGFWGKIVTYYKTESTELIDAQSSKLNVLKNALEKIGKSDLVKVMDTI